MLQLKNLKIYIENKLFIDNLNLKINDAEIHVLMGKNGIGKSSIAKTIMGDNNYKVTGSIIYNDKDITNFSINERANAGIYLVNQTPVQIEGVKLSEMLRMCISQKKETPVNIFEFNKELESICTSLELDKSFIHREINVGCSGGERKKIELMQMWILKPSFIILDEIDSGLDVDALKLVSKNILSYYEKYKPSILIITHSDTLINVFDKYFVHVIDNGKITKSGDKSLAKEIFSKGFKENIKANVISELDIYE